MATPYLAQDVDLGDGLPVYTCAADAFGSFVAAIPAPLGIGKVALADAIAGLGEAGQAPAADIARLDALARRYWHEAAVMGFNPEDYLQSHNELYELLRLDQREKAVHHWRAHIERFSAEAARHLPNPPLGA